MGLIGLVTYIPRSHLMEVGASDPISQNQDPFVKERIVKFTFY